MSDITAILSFPRISEARAYLKSAGYTFSNYGGNYAGNGGIDPRKECYEAGNLWAILRPIPFRGYRVAVFDRKPS